MQALAADAVLDRPGNADKEIVRDVRDQIADGHRALDLEAARHRVGVVAQRADGSLNLADQLRPDIVVLVEHPRNGCDGYIGCLCNILDGDVVHGAPPDERFVFAAATCPCVSSWPTSPDSGKPATDVLFQFPL
ncbi:hypothetical protein SDC9_211849 [bioreactor metagenome]|uniref:Uncharacterized protein n=1 Tax=bioreactor metagenome TaxID=1076179 RepID=A0A645JK80_9ZZZZ